MKTKHITALALAIAMLASACAGGSGDSSTNPNPAATSAESETGVGNTTNSDATCSGGAFPNDPDFRQLLCDVQNAQSDVMRAGGNFDPGWSARLTQATLKQATDRPSAVAELNALMSEMKAAAN